MRPTTVNMVRLTFILTYEGSELSVRLTSHSLPFNAQQRIFYFITFSQ